MAKIEHVERRLQNWTRWKISSGVLSSNYASLNWDEDSGRDGYREAKIPTIDSEAEETDSAIKVLPSELRRTVEVVYLENTGRQAHARRLCCSYDTVTKRIERAQLGLSRIFADLQAARKAAREAYASSSKKCFA